MARVNITIPDHLLEQARNADLNISRLAAAAITAELDKLSKIAALDDYLAELEVELGPMDPQKLAEARAWVDDMEAAQKQATATGQSVVVDKRPEAKRKRGAA